MSLASLNTLNHCSVFNSFFVSVNSVGFEQYGQCNGQSYVSSASSQSGGPTMPAEMAVESCVDISVTVSLVMIKPLFFDSCSDKLIYITG